MLSDLPMMSIGSQNRFVVPSAPKTVDSDAFPRVEYRPGQIAVIKLTPNTGRYEPPRIRVPRNRRQRVLGRMRKLKTELLGFHVPQPQLGTVFGAASDKMLAVRRPSKQSDSVRMAF